MWQKLHASLPGPTLASKLKTKQCSNNSTDQHPDMATVIAKGETSMLLWVFTLMELVLSSPSGYSGYVCISLLVICQCLSYFTSLNCNSMLTYNS
jgi:hypothetical protein